MPRVRIRLDSDGLAEVLRSSEVAGEVRRLGSSVATAAGSDGAVSRHGVPVTVAEYVARGGRLRSERPAVAVTLAHAAGVGIEAKYGALSRAAGEVGLTVTGGG